MDLSLIRVFVTIYETKNISHAAERLNLSQPSVTYNLNRLRQQLQDRLFIRGRVGVEPTKIAQELYPTFKQAIYNIESAIAEVQDFNPRTSHKTFRIGMSDIGEICLLPSLIAHLALHAPNIKIEVEEIQSDKVENWLIDGFLDIAVFNRQHTHMPNIETHQLFEERYVCLLRKDHPRIKEQLTMQQYLSEKHVAIKSSTGHIQVDKTLKELCRSRDIGLEVPHFSVLQGVLEQTDLLVTLPSRAAKYYLKNSDVNCFELPFKTDSFVVSQNWFKRSDDVVARRWLIQTVQQIFEKL